MSDAKTDLEGKLVEILTKSQDLLTDAFIFTQEQIPDIISQLLIWNGLSSFLICLFVICSIVFIVIFLRPKGKFHTWIINDNYDPEFTYTLSWFVGVIIICFLLGILSNNMDWLKILVAPKLYLLEYAKDFIK